MSDFFSGDMGVGASPKIDEATTWLLPQSLTMTCQAQKTFKILTIVFTHKDVFKANTYNEQLKVLTEVLMKANKYNVLQYTHHLLNIIRLPVSCPPMSTQF